MPVLTIEEAVALLKQEQIIAYPTEAVFGLGCCPRSEKALQRILEIKKRAPSKGMILIAASMAQLEEYVDFSKISSQSIQEILATWPGPFTWVFPVKNNVRPEITGEFKTVAVRVTAHPVAKALCEGYGGAIISTSANISQTEPFREGAQVWQAFSGEIAGVVNGEVGGLAQPTTIRDAITGKQYR